MADKWLQATRPGKCANKACGEKLEPGDHIYKMSAGTYLCNACGLIAEAEPPTVGALEASVEAELGKMPDEALMTSAAQSALYLARQVDMDFVTPRDLPNITKELRLCIATLKDQFPQTEDDDPTDKARTARERRAREQYGF